MANIIVDNSDGGYTETGTWTNFLNPTAAYNGSFRYNTISGDHADFAITGETNGQIYDVYASYQWNPSGRTPSALYVVKGQAGATLLTQTLDQGIDPSTLPGDLVIVDPGSQNIHFTHLGQFTADGTTGSIRISHSDTNTLTVDAIALVPFIPPPALGLSQTSGVISGVYTFTVPGTATSWTSGTTFSVAGGTAASISAQSINVGTQTGTITLHAGTTAGPLTISNSTDAGTALFQVVSVTPADTNAYASPNATFSDGVGSRQSNNVNAGSTYCEWLQPGNGIRYAVTSTTIFKWGVDVAALIKDAAASIEYPEIAYNVNGGAWTVVQLASGTPFPISLTGLSGTTQVEVLVKSINHNHDVWTKRCGVKHIGIVLSSGGSTAALTGYYAVRPNTAIAFTDSMGIPFEVNGGDDRGSDARVSWVRMQARRLNCELGIVCVGAIGYTVAGNGGVPAVPTSYAFSHTGASRLVAGLFSPAPKYALLSLGRNDTPGGTLQTAMQTFLGTIRIAAGALCTMLQYVDIPGLTRTNATAAVAAFKVANPSDTKVFLVDAGTDIALGFNGSVTYDSIDGTHANIFGEMYTTACYLAATDRALNVAVGSGGLSLFYPAPSQGPGDAMKPAFPFLGKNYRLNFQNGGRAIPANAITATFTPGTVPAGASVFPADVPIVAPGDGSLASAGIASRAFAPSATIANTAGALGGILAVNIDISGISPAPTPGVPWDVHVYLQDVGAAINPDDSDGQLLMTLSIPALTHRVIKI